MLYVQHIGWLHSTPRHEGRGRRRRQSRQASLKEQHSRLLELPPIQGGAHLIEWLWELGPWTQAREGPAAVSWQEVAAWSAMTATPITPEESSLLRRLSSECVSSYYRGGDPDCPPPYSAPVDHAQLGEHIKRIFRAHPRWKGPKC